MKAVQFWEFGGPLQIVDVPNPAVGSGEVVVTVRATGVCRSDWHGWQGHDPDIKSLPHIPGHEFSGVVAETGEGVRQWSAGDRVAVPFVLGCGDCEFCDRGQSQICPNQIQPGFHQWGSFAEQVVVPRADYNLIALPEEVSFEAAAALGCRFTTAYRAVIQQGHASPGQDVVVYGAGGVGLAAVQCAVMRGCKVVAVDPDSHAREFAIRLGASAAVTGVEVDQILDVVGSEPHLTVDAIGSPAVVESAVEILRRGGRHVQVGLLVGPDSPTPTRLDRVIARELEIVGSHGASPTTFVEIFGHIESGDLDPSQLVTTEIEIEDIPAVLAGFDSHAAGMTVASLG